MAIPTNIKNLLSRNVVEWAKIEFKERLQKYWGNIQI
jgi:hypothetical protein